MDLTPYVAALRDDLAAAAAVGDEATTRAGTSLAAALEPAVRLALMNALSDLAGEVSAALGDRTVSLRLSGRQVEVVVDRGDSGASGASGEGPDGFFAGPASSPFAGGPSGGTGGPHRHSPPPPPGPGFGGGEGPGSGFGGGGFGGFGGRGGPDVGDISRMTLRLVDQIKGQAERAAASQGMSLNSWIAQAVQGALQDKHRRGGWGGGDSGWGGWDAGWGSGSGSGDPGPGSGSGGPSGSSGTPGSPGSPGTPGSDSPGTGSPATAGPATGDGAPRADEGGPDSGPGGGPDGGPDGGVDGGVDGWVRG